MSKKVNTIPYLIMTVIFISIILPILLICLANQFTLRDLNDYFKGISIPIWVIIFASSKLYHKNKIEEIERLYLNEIKVDDPEVVKEAKRKANIPIQNKINRLAGLKSANNNLDKALGITGIIGAFFGIIIYILIQLL